jgi:hypothetical protein
VLALHLRVEELEELLAYPCGRAVEQLAEEGPATDALLEVGTKVGLEPQIGIPSLSRRRLLLPRDMLGERSELGVRVGPEIQSWRDEVAGHVV